jgi:predicted MFS family arabinose efflux permease
MSPQIIYCPELFSNITVDPQSEFTSRPTGATYQHEVSFVFLGLIVLFVAVFAIFKYIHPKRMGFHRIRGRDMRSIVLTHLGAALVIVSQSYGESNPYAYPCYAHLLIKFTMVPLMLFPLLGRLYIFHRKNELNSLIVKHSGASGTSTNMNQEDGSSASGERYVLY